MSFEHVEGEILERLRNIINDQLAAEGLGGDADLVAVQAALDRIESDVNVALYQSGVPAFRFEAVGDRVITIGFRDAGG